MADIVQYTTSLLASVPPPLPLMLWWRRQGSPSPAEIEDAYQRTLQIWDQLHDRFSTMLEPKSVEYQSKYWTRRQKQHMLGRFIFRDTLSGIYIGCFSSGGSYSAADTDILELPYKLAHRLFGRTRAEVEAGLVTAESLCTAAELERARQWTDRQREHLGTIALESDMENRTRTRARAIGADPGVLLTSAKAHKESQHMQCRICLVQLDERVPPRLHEERNGCLISLYALLQPYQHFSLDRILPGADGGDYTAGNTQLVCVLCQQLKWAWSPAEAALLLWLMVFQVVGHAARYYLYTADGELFGQLLNINSHRGAHLTLANYQEVLSAEAVAVIHAFVAARGVGSHQNLSPQQQLVLLQNILDRWVGDYQVQDCGVLLRNCVEDAAGLIVPLAYCDMDRQEPGSAYTGNERLLFYPLNRLRRASTHDHRVAFALFDMASLPPARLTHIRVNAVSASHTTAFPPAHRAFRAANPAGAALGGEIDAAEAALIEHANALMDEVQRLEEEAEVQSLEGLLMQGDEEVEELDDQDEDEED